MNQLFFISTCLSIGVVAGFLGGLLGIGGGVVIVPALILLLEWHPAFSGTDVTIVAVATSLGCVLFTSLSAATAQIRAGKVDWGILRRWSLFLILGSFTAGWFAEQLPIAVFRTLIAGFLLFVATVMLTNWEPAPSRVFPGLLGSLIAGIAGGLVSGIAGIGGGNVIVPSLIYFNVPVHRATATSSALGVPTAAAGLMGYAWVGRDENSDIPGLIGYVFFPGLIAIVIGAVLFAPVGVKVAHRVAEVPLRQVFGVLLVLVAARMFWAAYSLWGAH